MLSVYFRGLSTYEHHTWPSRPDGEWKIIRARRRLGPGKIFSAGGIRRGLPRKHDRFRRLSGPGGFSVYGCSTVVLICFTCPVDNRMHLPP